MELFSCSSKQCNHENATRCFELFLDESQDQTRRIHARQRAARTGTNPSSGKKIDIPARKYAYFRPGKTLRERGFRFVGPTTMYALMQSAGLVDDHVAGCWRAR